MIFENISGVLRKSAGISDIANRVATLMTPLRVFSYL